MYARTTTNPDLNPNGPFTHTLRVAACYALLREKRTVTPCVSINQLFICFATNCCSITAIPQNYQIQYNMS